jgi:hypothetical protein
MKREIILIDAIKYYKKWKSTGLIEGLDIEQQFELSCLLEIGANRLVSFVNDDKTVNHENFAAIFLPMIVRKYHNCGYFDIEKFFNSFKNLKSQIDGDYKKMGGNCDTNKSFISNHARPRNFEC